MSTTDNLRDAAYIVIGLGVIGFQRAQVRREELTKQFAAQRATLDAALTPVREALEAQIGSVAERLPIPRPPKS
ncbi:MAG: hypothetical protein QOI61_995 [Actinomycetota bacterium]